MRFSAGSSLWQIQCTLPTSRKPAASPAKAYLIQRSVPKGEAAGPQHRMLL